MIRNLIFDVGDVLVEYRWFEMLTRDYGLSEAEAKRIGEEMFDNEIWVQGLDGGRLSLEEAIPSKRRADGCKASGGLGQGCSAKGKWL